MACTSSSVLKCVQGDEGMNRVATKGILCHAVDRAASAPLLLVLSPRRAHLRALTQTHLTDGEVTAVPVHDHAPLVAAGDLDLAHLATEIL